MCFARASLEKTACDNIVVTIRGYLQITPNNYIGETKRKGIIFILQYINMSSTWSSNQLSLTGMQY